MPDSTQQSLIPPLIQPPRTSARKLLETDGTFRRVLFVMNPVSGRVTLKPYLQEVLRTFTLNGWLPTVYETAAKGDATAFVKAHAADYDLIVCAGGDGTLNEGVTALIEGGIDRPLGYIPCGSTNVFADCHGLPHNPIEAAEAIVTGTEKRLDVGSLNGRLFVFVAAFGIFSGLSYRTSQELKNVFGKGAYVLDALNDLLTLRRTHMTIEGTGLFPRISNETASFVKEKSGVLADGDFIFGAVNNSDSIASVVYLPPGLASYDDGYFEVFLIEFPDVQLDIQNIVSAIRTDDFFRSPYFTIFRTNEIRIKVDRGTEWALDGERAGGEQEFSFRVLPRAVRMILPQE